MKRQRYSILGLGLMTLVVWSAAACSPLRQAKASGAPLENASQAGETQVESCLTPATEANRQHEPALRQDPPRVAAGFQESRPPCSLLVWRRVNGWNVVRVCPEVPGAGGRPEPTGECTPACFPGRRQRRPKNKRIAPAGRFPKAGAIAG